MMDDDLDEEFEADWSFLEQEKKIEEDLMVTKGLLPKRNDWLKGIDGGEELLRNEKKLPPDTRPWDVENALILLCLLYPCALANGYNAHLGGSVMYNGYSENDLDIVFVRRANVLECTSQPVYNKAKDMGYSSILIDVEIPFRRIVKMRNPGHHGNFQLFHRTNVDLIFIDLKDGETQDKPVAIGDSDMLSPEESEKRFELLTVKVCAAAEKAMEKVKAFDEAAS